YTSESERIERFDLGTGFWSITNKRHPDYIEPSPSFSQYRERADTLGEEDAPGPSTLQKKDNSDEDLYRAPSPPATTTQQHEQVDPVELETARVGIEQVLTLEERESALPELADLFPDQPYHLRQIRGAVSLGIPIPDPPPRIQTPSQLIAPSVFSPKTQTTTQTFGALIPPQTPTPMAGQGQQQAPAVKTGAFRGKETPIFNANRNKSKTFMRDFEIYWALNDNHQVFLSPYNRVIVALALIRGPQVEDWAHAQLDELKDKVRRAQNPIARTDEDLWRDFQTAFTAAFTDTTQAQEAYYKIHSLEMRGRDLDYYTSTFRTLANKAGFSLQDRAVVDLYARGIHPQLLARIIDKVNPLPV